MGGRRAAAAAFLSMLAASCTSAGDPMLSAGMPGYSAAGPTDLLASSDTNALTTDSAATMSPATSAMAEDDAPLPEQVASVPSTRPDGGLPAAAPAETETIAAAAPQPPEAAAQPAPVAAEATAETAFQAEAGVPTPQPRETAAAASPAMDDAAHATAAEMPAQPIAPRKRSFLSAFFGTSAASAGASTEAEAVAAAAPQPPEAAGQPAAAEAKAETAEAAAGVPTPQPKPREIAAAAAPAMDDAVHATAAETPAPPIAPRKKSFLSAFFGTSAASAAPSPIVDAKAARQAAKPIITPASAGPDDKPIALASLESHHNYTSDALPGVRQTALFEIRRKSGIDDDSDVDLNEDEGGPYRVASAAGLARLAPNGLLRQTESVDVACLKPSLVRVLKTIEAHYGRKMIVTSGYRDPNRNRRARGAKNSLHMYCAAADIQIPGVAKWELASYVRSMPGRGGVGTYCHTESVHVDVGPERDWNWRCRRRK